MIVREFLVCSKCDHAQTENVVAGEKFSWMCDWCNALYENEGVHILQKEEIFVGLHGENICVGFGARITQRPQVLYDVNL